MGNSNKENRTTTTKEPKMKIFQSTQKNFITVGIHAKLALQPYPLNVKIVIGFLLTSLYTMCNLVYIFFKTETSADYTQCIYMGSIAVLIIFALIIIVLNVKELYQIINDCENLVNACESKVFSLPASFD